MSHASVSQRRVQTDAARNQRRIAYSVAPWEVDTPDRVRSDPLSTVDLSVFTEPESYVLTMLTRPVPKQKEDVTLNKL